MLTLIEITANGVSSVLVAHTTEAQRREFSERAERAGYTVRFTPAN